MNASAEEKIQQLKSGGASKLHILSDFDRTLTYPTLDGKKVPSLISLLRDNNFLTPDYPEKAHRLFNTYHAIEMDPTVLPEEKKEKMKEWWTKHFELLIASGLTKQDIQQAMSSRKARLRFGCDEFFNLLDKHQIPLIIMSSSGLGVDSIQMFLEAEKEMRKNISIISNQYVWDANGKATAVKEPIIHGMNKDETIVKDLPEIYARVENRTNVLLLGDNPSDLGMITGFPYTGLLTVGFSSEPNHFDLLLDVESSLNPIIKILKDVIQ